jgi:hypothetical protein
MRLRHAGSLAAAPRGARGSANAATLSAAKKNNVATSKTSASSLMPLEQPA